MPIEKRERVERVEKQEDEAERHVEEAERLLSDVPAEPKPPAESR